AVNTVYCTYNLRRPACVTMEGGRRPARRFWQEDAEDRRHRIHCSPSPSASPQQQPPQQCHYDLRPQSANRAEVKIPPDTEEEDSSEMRILPFSVEKASHSFPDGPAASLTEPGRRRSWRGGKRDGWVLLRLHEKALLSFLRVRNRSTTEISISISVKGLRRRDFVQVKREVKLSHGSVTDVKIGHLPCVFVRLDCRRNGDGGVSLHELVPVGIPAKGFARFMGPFMEDLAYRSTERLLFGPSLQASHAPVCSAAAIARLILPPPYLRPALEDVNFVSNATAEVPPLPGRRFPPHPVDHPGRGLHRLSSYGGGVGNDVLRAARSSGAYPFRARASSYQLAGAPPRLVQRGVRHGIGRGS
ncbi:unnamed protein product, partial [Ascophyllum nodosum]